MRAACPILVLLAIITTYPACHKKQNPESTEALLKEKWQITSLNGEALRYVGQPADYFDFGSDTLIEFYGGKHDTFRYMLIGPDTLQLQHLSTGVNPDVVMLLFIQSLTRSQLILSGGTRTPPVSILDSLHR